MIRTKEALHPRLESAALKSRSRLFEYARIYASAQIDNRCKATLTARPSPRIRPFSTTC